jgi:hypothetical protein
MPDIKGVRRRFSLLIAVLLCLDVAAIAILVSPIGRGARAGQKQANELQQVLLAKTREVVPLRGIDEKIVDAKQQVAEFYRDRLPASSSSISERLGKVASSNNVQITKTTYKIEDADIPDVSRVVIQTMVSGDYAQTVKFINALEREKLLFIIDSVSLAQSQGGMVQLQVRLETYMRTA